MANLKKPRAATLAVGTELTDGQIFDRNSAWISQQLVQVGIEVIEHRAVPDEKADIEKALIDLAGRVDLLFVTGGLGPTSDDFTRDVLSSQFGLPLEYHETSWQKIVAMLNARGVAVREIQKQQCYFPRTARVIDNPAGTANAFMFESDLAWAPGRHVKVYALPGPPQEIAAIWEKSIHAELSPLVGEAERETLHLYRCLGRAESEVAEITETAIAGTGIRVGYRAHVPYVEVKLWVPGSRRAELAPVLAKVEAALGEWITNRNDEDVAGQFLSWVASRKGIVRVRDVATGGWLTERLVTRVREAKVDEAQLPLVIETALGMGASSEVRTPGADEVLIKLEGNETSKAWRISVKQGEAAESVLEVKAPYNYNFRAERSRKFITEKALHLLVTGLLPR